MKTILITGASSGLGKAVGDFLKDKGYQVFGTSRNPERYPESRFPLLALDVRDGDGIRKCVNEVVHLAGSLDVLVNNAGVGIIGPLEDIPTDEIRNHLEVNLIGPVEVIKAVLPQMRQQKSGHIINITSIAGYTGLPFRSVYSAGKGAFELLSEGLRMEVQPFGIRVSCVAPGEFATKIADGRYYAPKTSAYEATYGKTLESINAQVDAGDDPVLVARMVAKILETPEPKIHYKVGPLLSRFSIVLKRLLPDRTYEKMVMKHYGLSGGK